MTGWTIAHEQGIDVLVARRIWLRLSLPARAAIQAAYPDGPIVAHPLTLNTLERHGFMTGNVRLTDAGKAMAKWCVTK